MVGEKGGRGDEGHSMIGEGMGTGRRGGLVGRLDAGLLASRPQRRAGTEEERGGGFVTEWWRDGDVVVVSPFLAIVPRCSLIPADPTVSALFLVAAIGSTYPVHILIG